MATAEAEDDTLLSVVTVALVAGDGVTRLVLLITLVPRCPSFIAFKEVELNTPVSSVAYVA